jgi:hypothetical protein
MLHVVRAGDGPLTCPGIPAGGHGLLPQLQARERAAHTGTVSERAFGKIGQNSRRNSNGFQS